MRIHRVKPLLLAAIGLLVICIILFPYINMALTSVKSDADVYAVPPRFFPLDWVWSNYVTVWQQVDLANWLQNSIFITVTSTVVTLLIATPAAYHLARYNFRFKRGIMLVLLISQMVTPTVVIIGLYREFLTFGLINTQAALIIVNIAFNLSFAVWILTSFFRSIPEEVMEAALLDGCTDLRTLVRVVLPMAAPGVITAIIFTFVSVWNEYVVALLLINDTSKLPLAVGITTFQGQYTVQWQYLFATAIIAVVPVVVLFALVERHLVSGLTAGSTK